MFPIDLELFCSTFALLHKYNDDLHYSPEEFNFSEVKMVDAGLSSIRDGYQARDVTVTDGNKEADEPERMEEPMEDQTAGEPENAAAVRK